MAMDEDCMRKKSGGSSEKISFTQIKRIATMRISNSKTIKQFGE